MQGQKKSVAGEKPESQVFIRVSSTGTFIHRAAYRWLILLGSALAVGGPHLDVIVETIVTALQKP